MTFYLWQVLVLAVAIIAIGACGGYLIDVGINYVRSKKDRAP